MPTLEKQLELEEYMVNRGVERFRDQQEKAKESRAHESSAGSTLMRSYVLGFSDYLQSYIDGKQPGRRRSKYSKLMETVDTDKVAMFTLRFVIGAIFQAKAPALQSICHQIGGAIEDELRFSLFQSEHKEYYDALIRDFERKNTSSYSHQRRVLAAKSQDKGIEWREWSFEEKAGLGQVVISLLNECCDLVEKVSQRNSRGQRIVAIVPTAQCIDWIERHEGFAELAHPERLPCIIEPAEWTGPDCGGYYSAQMRERTPLVNSRSNRNLRHKLMEEAEMSQVYKAVNAAQKTPWVVNDRVFEVMKEVWKQGLGCGLPRSQPYVVPTCPLSPEQNAKELPEGSKEQLAFQEWKGMAREMYTKEEERKAKSRAVIRTIRLATMMQQIGQFWFVYQLDFRGRMYATVSGLSPQGNDFSKGMLMFARGKALGSKDGEDWFKINGANKYGYDKASYPERIRWVDAQSEKWCAVADDPIRHRALWSAADKPFQFLGWCFEYADYIRCVREGDGASFVSHLPVGLDGSCNGLQHFSAMLRDQVGGAAVNLRPTDAPADIYQAVGDVCTAKLRARAEAGEGAAINWLRLLPDGKVPRGLAKKPVMTLPYGSTQQACTQSIYSFAIEKGMAFDKNTAFRHSIYLSPILWESIGEVVIAARAAMDWIQKCAGVVAKSGNPLLYTSPLGFPVLQANQKRGLRRIETQIGGRMSLQYTPDIPAVDSHRMRNGSSPNLVHHVDATHMMMAVLASMGVGIEDFALIHDDFGTHAADTATFQRMIQETFVTLHKDHNVLAEFKRVHEERLGIELPDMPDTGDLDINEVLDAMYFFG